jgi:hypothetical protein
LGSIAVVQGFCDSEIAIAKYQFLRNNDHKKMILVRTNKTMPIYPKGLIVPNLQKKFMNILDVNNS